MAEPFTVDAGARYAFAPSPEPIEGSLHRIRIAFQASDGRVWTTGTDMIAPALDSEPARRHRARDVVRLPDGVPHGINGNPLRPSMIVPAPNVSISGKGAMRALEIWMWGYL